MNAGQIFVAGKWQAPISGETYQPINPANEEPLAPVVRIAARPAWSDPVLHLLCVLIYFEAAGRTRREVVDALKARGVGSQVHYIPVHRQPYYRERYGDLDLPGAEAWYARCLSLPLYPGMADGDVEKVVGALREVLAL